jgi:dsDNA-binding SOS-regulon protein
MIRIKPEYLGKGVIVGLVRHGSQYSAIDLDNCTQEELQFLVEINHDAVEQVLSEKKKPITDKLPE